jgi:chromosomal replication initiator protein
MTTSEHPRTMAGDFFDWLRRNISQKKFDLWFSGMRCTQLDDGRVELVFEDSFQLEWIQANYRHLIDAGIETVFGKGVEIAFKVEASSRTLAPTAPVPTVEFDGPAVAPAAPSEAPPEGISLNPQYTFDSFIVGPSNQLGSAAARAVADAPAGSYNPLFLHGATGLGKTHLLQAICHRAMERRPDLKVLYLSSEAFVNQFIAAIEAGELDRFRYKHRSVDLLLIDDVHLLAHKDRTQEEFFHTFNTLYNERRQIVLSSDCAPTEIPTLRDRLVSRFEWGLVAEIAQPHYETRFAILQRKARDRGVELPHDVLSFLAERIERNIRELEGAITKVLGYAELFGKPIDLDLARQALRETGEGGSRPVTRTEEIMTVVCRHYGVTSADVRGRRRTQSIVEPRQVFMFLARKHTNMSFEEIGRSCGGRDHSTVLYAVRKVEKRVATDSGLARTLDDLTAELKR